LDGSPNNASWEEVEAPGIENFERVRDNLQNPKRLKLGPLLVAAVQASPSRLLQDFQELRKLNPSLGDVVGQEDTHGNAWLVTIFQDWNHISDNFLTVSQELQKHANAYISIFIPLSWPT
jgi:hypothetical protein